MLYVIEPYAIDKNLGRAYNDHIRHYDAEDWICIKDIDVTFLTPDAISHIHEYTQRHPEAGLFTCFTNRIANPEQLLHRRMSNVDSMKYHIRIAKIQQHQHLYDVTKLTRPVSGFLMVIKKETWDQVKFTEDMLCLGVDNDYHRRLAAAGKQVLRMNGIYVWHTYRILTGRRDKSHLTAPTVI